MIIITLPFCGSLGSEQHTTSSWTEQYDTAPKPKKLKKNCYTYYKMVQVFSASSIQRHPTEYHGQSSGPERPLTPWDHSTASTPAPAKSMTLSTGFVLRIANGYNGY